MDANMAEFLFMQEAEELEADIIEDELRSTQLSAVLLIAGAREGQILRSERRNQTRSYRKSKTRRHGKTWVVVKWLQAGLCKGSEI